MNKWRNKKVPVEGIMFDSMGEAARYSELRILEQSGQVRELEVQPRFPIVIQDYAVGRYSADFRYIDDIGRVVVEEHKGDKRAMSRDAILRMKLFRALYQVNGWCDRYMIHCNHQLWEFDEWVKPKPRKRRRK